MKVCIDIGGSFTRGGLVKDGKIIKRVQVPTKFGKLDSIFEVLDELMQEGVSGIGIGIAGMTQGGRVLLGTANMGLGKVALADMVEKKYKVPCRLANDVACFALAQAKSFKGNLVYVTLGTGMNVGVVFGGKLLEGIEYGHTHLMTNDKGCSCGLNGCVEQFISGKALAPNSKELPRHFLAHLVIVLLNIANTYRPQKIFIGGGLAGLVAPHVKWINQELKNRNYGYKGAPPVTVEISKLKDDGGILGACNLFNTVT